MKKRKAGKNSKNIEINCGSSNACSGAFGCGYFLGFIGASIYYISTASGFWNGVFGVLKALFWPGVLVFEVMKFIGV